MTDAIRFDAVAAHDHACLTFSDDEDRLDLVATFVRDGLAAGVKVVCWTDRDSPDELVEQLAARSVDPYQARRDGRLRLAPVVGSLLAHDQPTAASMVDVVAAEVDSAHREGFSGLRVTVDMSWATRPLATAAALTEFETAVAELFGTSRLCLICQYHRDKFDPVTLAFAAKAHPKTVAAQVYHDHPLLRICRQYSPPGIRIAGQLDFRHREVLEQALTETLRLDEQPMVNLVGLDYIDAACAGVIVAAATSLAPQRTMSVRCRRRVGKVLEVCGGPAVTGLLVEVRP
ncbi:MEDS domain-containing protein [Dactylosporangium sp. CA-052675]|uniref:MEDS domain-containing protein n=1 Tax=Dactylosporangium sp. CA-052675 TaxID=3239927 RepID=UPI003D935C6E